MCDLFGRGGRSRTHLRSFGDSYSTDELHPYVICVLKYYTRLNSKNQDFFMVNIDYYFCLGYTNNISTNENGEFMKKLFKKLTELSQENVERIIAEKCENDEQIEDIVNYKLLSDSDRALIDENISLEIDEIIDIIKKQDYVNIVNSTIQRCKDLTVIKKVRDIEFILRMLSTKITMFNTTITGLYFKEMILPFFNEEKSNNKLLIKYRSLDNDIYKLSRVIDSLIYKIMLAACNYENLYNDCLVLFQDISMYIILGERKLKKVIVQDMSKLNSSDSPDLAELDQIEEISTKSTELESLIFNLKQFRVQIVMLIKNIFYILMGSDKLLAKTCTSLTDAFRRWKIKSSLVIEDKSMKQYNGKMTQYTDDLSIRHVGLIDMEDFRNSQNSQLKKRTILKANKELRASLYEFIEICEKKENRIEAFKEILNNIEVEPQDI